MMTDVELTNAQVAAQVERTDRFVADFREMVAATAVDPASDAHRRGLERIAATVDQVDYVLFCNLANLNAALRGGLFDLIDVHLLAVGGGPTLDFADATAFLARFETVIGGARCGACRTVEVVIFVATRTNLFTVPFPDGERHQHCDGAKSKQHVLPVDNGPLYRDER